ncbi:MAG: NERD domain-containing protein [Eubacterium sp.]|nr:NERD domain-containing protein [Eubacterium sp.]
MYLLILMLIVFVLFIVLDIVTFNKSTYHLSTNNSYFATRNDKGKFGEYLIFKRLKYLEAKGCKFLFNVYLPKDNGETTEIDVMLIARKGIVVFESKNYSGWIFGNEKSKNWTQTLPQGKGRSLKEHFFNPIMQNNLHIKCLKNVIGEDYPIHSIIAFSERCTLKNITVYSSNIQVVKRNDVDTAIAKIFNPIENPLISEEEINRLYELLYPYSQVSEQVKQEHIANIKSKHN